MLACLVRLKLGKKLLIFCCSACFSVYSFLSSPNPSLFSASPFYFPASLALPTTPAALILLLLLLFFFPPFPIRPFLPPFLLPPPSLFVPLLFFSPSSPSWPPSPPSSYNLPPLLLLLFLFHFFLLLLRIFTLLSSRSPSSPHFPRPLSFFSPFALSRPSPLYLFLHLLLLSSTFCLYFPPSPPLSPPFPLSHYTLAQAICFRDSAASLRPAEKTPSCLFSRLLSVLIYAV